LGGGSIVAGGSGYERELKALLESDGWYVVRSAGSLAVDLVALDPENGHTLLIEVKSFTGKTYYTSKNRKTKEQQREMVRLQRMFNGNCSVFYALRKKGQSDFHFVHPHKLSKPYHWNQEAEDGEVHCT
jgi:Holliday junction resolvase